MENEQKKIDVKEGGIDKDVLEVAIKQRVEEALNNPTSIKRIIFNAFCELLSEFKKVSSSIDDLNNLISVIGADKIDAYFRELKGNIKTEAQEQGLAKKISASHKKSCKKSKITLQ